MLELRDIIKIYQGGTVNETCLFNGFSLAIPDGQFVCVVGSNGSGKTSLLNIICGSIPIDEGQVLIGGENITHMPEHKRHRRIGRVYQNPALGTPFRQNTSAMAPLQRMPAPCPSRGQRPSGARRPSRPRLAIIQPIR